MNPQEFINIISPIAIQLRREGSAIFPSVRIAQAAHETGWMVHPWNNLVGFKVGSRPPNGFWKGAYVNKGTWEVYDGKRTDVVAAFRAYDTIEDCFRDQDELFKIPRYDQVRTSPTWEDQCVALYRCGYATDPEYYKKLISMIQKYDLKQFDVGETTLEKTFKDVPNGYWAAGVIKVVNKSGIMTGYEDGTFQPDKPVTRAELAKVVNDLLYLINKN